MAKKKEETLEEMLAKRNKGKGKKGTARVYIGKHRKKFMIVDEASDAPWANEYFKDAAEAADFAVRNNLLLVDSKVAEIDADKKTTDDGRPHFKPPFEKAPDPKKDDPKEKRLIGGRYLELFELPNGNLKICITDEGREKIKEDGISYDNFRDYLEDIEDSSAFTYVADLGDAGFGMTGAPGIAFEYHFDDDGNLTNAKMGENGEPLKEIWPNSKVWYYDDYAILFEGDQLKKHGYVVYNLAPNGDEYAKGGKLEKKEIFSLDIFDQKEDSFVDVMPITSSTYYSEEEAMRAAKKWLEENKDGDRIIYLNYGEYETPQGTFGDVEMSSVIALGENGEPELRFAKGGKLEKDNPIVLEIVAENVALDTIDESKKYLELDEKRTEAKKSLMAYLIRRANATYDASAKNSPFRKSLRGAGDRGRDNMYSWMEHWAAAYVHAGWKAPKGEESFAKGGKADEYWIKDAISEPGALRRKAAKQGLIHGDEKLSEADLKKLESEGGRTAKEAHLAETLRKFEFGGPVKQKQQLYRIKVSDGYIKDPFSGDKYDNYYTRGDAIKKARIFDGKIERAYPEYEMRDKGQGKAFMYFGSKEEAKNYNQDDAFEVTIHKIEYPEKKAWGGPAAIGEDGILQPVYADGGIVLQKGDTITWKPDPLEDNIFCGTVNEVGEYESPSDGVKKMYGVDFYYEGGDKKLHTWVGESSIVPNEKKELGGPLESADISDYLNSFAKGGEIKGKKKIYLESILRRTALMIDGKGPDGDTVQESAHPIHKEFDTPLEMFVWLEESEFGLSADPKDYSAPEASRIDCSKLEDADGFTVKYGEAKFKAWKRGEVELWLADYSIRLSYMTTEEISVDKFKEDFDIKEWASDGTAQKAELGGVMVQDLHPIPVDNTLIGHSGAMNMEITPGPNQSPII